MYKFKHLICYIIENDLRYLLHWYFTEPPSFVQITIFVYTLFIFYLLVGRMAEMVLKKFLDIEKDGERERGK